MAKLTPSQLAIVKRIAQIGKQVGATPKEVKAALATGRVESNFSNSSKMTDHDSQGWRQERASLYKDPTNLDASIRRFYKETRAVKDKYGTAGALAAAVQRPAAQYRGRYQDNSAEAQQLLNTFFRGKGGGVGEPASAGGTTTTIRTPGTTRLQQTEETVFDQAGYDKQARMVALKGVLEGFSKGKPSLFASVLPDTADPAAFTSTKTGVKTIKTPGSTITTTTGGGGPTRTKGSGGSAKGGAGVPGLKGKGSGVFELFYDPQGGWKNGTRIPAIGGHSDHVHVAAGPNTSVALGKLAQSMGLTVRENAAFDKVDPVHTNGSWHYRYGGKGAIDVSGDPSKMAAYTRRVRKIYGLK